MANEKIFYRAADCNMGDCTEQDCEMFRAWALAEIKAAYPDAAQIEVLNEDRGSTVFTEEDDEECAILEFLFELWDRCPWYGEHFD
jgi:hypothetical protein